MKKILATIILSLAVVTYMGAQNKSTPLQQSVERGSKVYMQWCMACHQKDGGGVPRLNPPLAKTHYVTGDKKRLINIILKGMNEEIEVNGQVYTNAMAPFSHLNDQQVADVSTYIRNSFGNKASAVTVAEVKALRAKGK